VWGHLLIGLAFIIVGFPFSPGGYVPLAVGAGYLYGMVQGTITISVGALMGASVAFWVCRTMTHDCMKRSLENNPKWHVFMREVERNAWQITLLSRLLPFPFGLVNGFFAFSSISYHVYLIGSFIGLLPFQLMWTYFGTTLRSIADAVTGEIPFGPFQTLLLLLQLGLGVGLMLYLVYTYVHLAKTLEPSISDEDEKDIEDIIPDITTEADEAAVEQEKVSTVITNWVDGAANRTRSRSLSVKSVKKNTLMIV